MVTISSEPLDPKSSAQDIEVRELRKMLQQKERMVKDLITTCQHLERKVFLAEQTIKKLEIAIKELEVDLVKICEPVQAK